MQYGSRPHHESDGPSARRIVDVSRPNPVRASTSAAPGLVDRAEALLTPPRKRDEDGLLPRPGEGVESQVGAGAGISVGVVGPTGRNRARRCGPAPFPAGESSGPPGTFAGGDPATPRAARRPGTDPGARPAHFRRSGRFSGVPRGSPGRSGGLPGLGAGPGSPPGGGLGAGLVRTSAGPRWGLGGTSVGPWWVPQRGVNRTGSVRRPRMIRPPRHRKSSGAASSRRSGSRRSRVASAVRPSSRASGAPRQ